MSLWSFAPQKQKEICLCSGSRFSMAIDWWRLRNLLFKRTMCINYSHGFRGKPTDITIFVYFFFPLSLSFQVSCFHEMPEKKIIQRFFRDWTVFWTEMQFCIWSTVNHTRDCDGDWVTLEDDSWDPFSNTFHGVAWNFKPCVLLDAFWHSDLYCEI